MDPKNQYFIIKAENLTEKLICGIFFMYKTSTKKIITLTLIKKLQSQCNFEMVCLYVVFDMFFLFFLCSMKMSLLDQICRSELSPALLLCLIKQF